MSPASKDKERKMNIVQHNTTKRGRKTKLTPQAQESKRFPFPKYKPETEADLMGNLDEECQHPTIDCQDQSPRIAQDKTF